MRAEHSSTAALAQKKLYIFDMDGTIYLGNRVFPFAIRFISNLRKGGKRVLFFTNNASHSPEFYLEKLSRMGFAPNREEIMTAGDVTAEFLIRHRAGKSVYLVGTDDLASSFTQKGIPLLGGEEADADIAMGRRHGVTAVLVLSGETTLADVEVATEADRPDFVFDSLDEVDRAMFSK